MESCKGKAAFGSQSPFETCGVLSLKKSRSVDFNQLKFKLQTSKMNDMNDYSFDNCAMSRLKTRNGQCSQWRSSENLQRLMLGEKDEQCLSYKGLNRSIDSLSKPDYEDVCRTKVVSDQHRWNVGKISFFMLVLFSLTDLILNMVDAQMDTIDATEYYDALSSEVIRPAFHYHSTASDRKSKKPRLGLGSAAISSVTDALSPVLPFAGGLDLRREDYWSNGILGSVSSVYEQVCEAFSRSSPDPNANSATNIPRGGGKVAKGKSRSKKSRPSHTFALSSSEPFVPLKDIAAMTLKEVALAFQFALKNNRKDFNSGKLMSQVSPHVRKVFEKMSYAAALSRGKGVQAPVTGISLQSGDIDALEFCAALRIFAEWRVLRQLPEGYKGYAVGITLGQKDIIQNVGKIEQAAHNYIDHFADISESESVAPTLRNLLQYEVDMNIQDSTKLPRLKEKSAAMGLLWVRRQLQYQTAIFANVVRVPERFASAKDAVSAAYSEVYDKLHGWAVQKIFNYSFQAAPDAIEIFKVMNPTKLEEVTQTARMRATGEGQKGGGKKKPLFGNKKSDNPVEKILKHIGREWDKIARPIAQVFGHKPAPMVEQMRGGSDTELASQLAEMDAFIDQKMEEDAHEHILEYLEVAQPLLNDLAKLFDEFNMDDPTKV